MNHTEHHAEGSKEKRMEARNVTGRGPSAQGGGDVMAGCVSSP